MQSFGFYIYSRERKVKYENFESKDFTAFHRLFRLQNTCEVHFDLISCAIPLSHISQIKSISLDTKVKRPSKIDGEKRVISPIPSLLFQSD